MTVKGSSATKGIRQSEARVSSRSHKPTTMTCSRLHSAFGVIVVLLWTVTLSSYLLDRHVLPRYYLSHEHSRSVPKRMCGPQVMTTDELEDIVMDEDDSIYDMRRIVYKHGAAVIPDVLSNETTIKLRHAITSRHDQEQTGANDFFVLNREDRRRLLLNVNDDAIYGKALEEIATHEIMRPLIDQLAGPDAALVGLFSITNLYGSEAQPWHSDNQFHLSRREFPDDYHRVYSIVFALQDTTEAMGSTGLCLGTQHCKGVSYEAAKGYCIPSAPLEAGGALIFDADIFHRGGGHVDPNAPDRVMFFVVLAPSESMTLSKRWLPTRYFQLRWDMFGHSIHDFVQNRPWTKWQALFSFKKGYSFVSYVLRLVANGMAWRFHVLGQERAIDWDTVEDVWQTLLPMACGTACLWVCWWWAIQRFSGKWNNKKVASKTL